MIQSLEGQFLKVFLQIFFFYFQGDFLPIILNCNLILWRTFTLWCYYVAVCLIVFLFRPALPATALPPLSTSFNLHHTPVSYLPVVVARYPSHAVFSTSPILLCQTVSVVSCSLCQMIMNPMSFSAALQQLV